MHDLLYCPHSSPGNLEPVLSIWELLPLRTWEEEEEEEERGIVRGLATGLSLDPPGAIPVFSPPIPPWPGIQSKLRVECYYKGLDKKKKTLSKCTP